MENINESWKRSCSLCTAKIIGDIRQIWDSPLAGVCRQQRKIIKATKKEYLAIVWGITEMRTYIEIYKLTVIRKHLRKSDSMVGRRAAVLQN